ncbi:VWA domain-containing protein [Eionea flava]
MYVKNVSEGVVCITPWCRYVLPLLLFLFVSMSHAQAPEANSPSDVRLVIDISGSMKKNDPQNLRRPALDMLVQLLPEGSKAGIWTFGQYVNMLVPHKPVTTAWGRQATASSSEIRSIAQFTNIGAALKKAAYDHKQLLNGNANYQTHVILLTDGMVDIDRDNARNIIERQRILDDVLPLYQQAGIALHTIALSDNADKKLLNQLALGTDAKVAVAKNAEELMSVFLQVFNQAVPLETVAFDGETFAVDSSIEEFTALIFRQGNAKATTVVAPDGVSYDKNTQDKNVRWYHTEQYDLITVKQPIEGEWGVSADVAPQSRVTVVSDLSVAVKSMPTNIAVDEVIQTSLALREENAIITRSEFLELLTITANITSDTGNTWSQKLSSSQAPSDGIYSATFNQFSQQGDYTIDFVVEGKTFNRQYSHLLSVRTPFSVDSDKSKTDGLTTYTVEVISQSPTVDVSQTTVTGIVEAPSGSINTLRFDQQNDGSWLLNIPVKESGDYLVDIRVNSTDNQGVREKITLEPLRLSLNDDIFTSPPPIVESVVEPPVVENKPPVEEPTVEPATEETPVQEDNSTEEKTDYSQYILYGIIGFINLLIIIIGYIIYRKLFKKPSADDDSENDDASEKAEEDPFAEPPMDEMAVDELLEDELSEESLPEESVPEEMPEAEPLDDDEELEGDLDDLSDTSADDAMAAALTDAEDSEDDDDIPDFSLDDFAPENLEEDELNEELDLDEEESKN